MTMSPDNIIQYIWKTMGRHSDVRIQDSGSVSQILWHDVIPRVVWARSFDRNLFDRISSKTSRLLYFSCHNRYQWPLFALAGS